MKTTGGCLCGKVTYSITGPIRPVVACHCSQCRKTSGHFVAATAASPENVEVAGEVTWYQSSNEARRGFCGTCGSSLFWEGYGHLSIHAGSIDGETGLKIERHIFAADKGDYYEIDDDKPQFDKV